MSQELRRRGTERVQASRGNGAPAKHTASTRVFCEHLREMTLLPDLVLIGLWLALITGVCSVIGLVTSRRLLWNPADPLILVLVYVAMNVSIIVVLADANHQAILNFVLIGFGAFLLGLHAFRPDLRKEENASPLRPPGARRRSSYSARQRRFTSCTTLSYWRGWVLASSGPRIPIW